MTADDINVYSRRTLMDIIDKMKNELIDVKRENTDPMARMIYNTAIQDCVSIVNKTLRNTGDKKGGS